MSWKKLKFVAYHNIFRNYRLYKRKKLEKFSSHVHLQRINSTFRNKITKPNFFSFFSTCAPCKMAAYGIPHAEYNNMKKKKKLFAQKKNPLNKYP